jgi:hypothetical protein
MPTLKVFGNTDFTTEYLDILKEVIATSNQKQLKLVGFKHK